MRSLRLSEKVGRRLLTPSTTRATVSLIRRGKRRAESKKKREHEDKKKKKKRGYPRAGPQGKDIDKQSFLVMKDQRTKPSDTTG